jgi:hypothetical protein
MTLRDSGVMRGVMRGVGNLHGFDGGGGVPIPTDGDLLIEDFEVVNGNGVPTNGPWNQVSLPDVTISQSGLNVTEGLYSSQWSDSQASFSTFNVLENFDNFIDLSAYSELKLDVTIASNSAGTYASVFVSDSNFINFGSADTTPGATGTSTLTFDLTTIAVGRNACYIEIGIYGSFPRSTVLRFDNLRAFT